MNVNLNPGPASNASSGTSGPAGLLIATALSVVVFLAGIGSAPTPAKAAVPTCFGMKATKVSAAKRIVGKKGHDVIVALGSGPKVIDGKGGNDRICGGPGPERLIGGRGNDRLDGGGGKDRLFGVTGNDRLAGGPGNDFLEGFRGNDRLDGGGGDDWVRGNRGNDRLKGGSGDDLIEGVNGDDFLKGGPGADRLNGGPGTDSLEGEGGADILRGDSGGDTLLGGSGEDIASWSSAANGVTVNLAVSSKQTTRDGDDVIRGVEDVVGSAFADFLLGDSGANRIDGGPGFDYLDGRGGRDEAFGGPDGAECEDFEKQSGCGVPPTPSGATVVILSRGLDGNTFVVNGDDSDNRLTISRTSTALRVEENGDDPIDPGSFENSGCREGADARQAICPSTGSLTSILVTGGDGDDTLRVGSGFSGRSGARINGGDGSDTIYGGPADDYLEAGYPYRFLSEGGPTVGNDRLFGGGGDDGLFADRGSDLLSGDRGSDLLVSSKDICQGHRMVGGPGQDNASWAQVRADKSDYSGSMRMEIGGKGGPTSRCQASLDSIGDDVESLEGSLLDDVLIGDSGRNSFYGQSGADTFIGRGGEDFIDARDNERDRRIDCGGAGTAVTDGRDPAPVRCG